MFSRRTALPFVDLTMILLAFIVLLINPPAKQADAKPVADFMLYMAWDLGRDTDVDVYVKGPDGQVIWYSRKDAGYMSIDRDDLGMRRDSGGINQEVASFRSPPDGTYYVSIHTYREADNGPGHVALELDSRQGTNLWSTALSIPALDEEVPIVEFVFKDGVYVRAYPSEERIRYGAKKGPVS